MKVRVYMTMLAAGLLSVGLTTAPAYAVCANPFGGEDPGCIPPDAPKGPIAKCESVVAKAGGKLIVALTNCHIGRVSGKYADANAEELCESNAFAKFAATKTAGCAPCVSLPALQAAIHTSVDATVGDTFCAE